jgi:hypothetical protein
MAAKTYEVRLNYHALTVSILAGCSVETAFEKIQSAHPDAVKQQITPEDVEDMKKFRDEGMGYREIAELYNVPWTTVHGRIRPRWRRTCTKNNSRKCINS